MSELKLKKKTAYTVYSSDNEIKSSEKGLYKDHDVASKKAVGSGWYGSNGVVMTIDVWEAEDGKLYTVNPAGDDGKFTDESEQYKKDIRASIKAKLTPEELSILGIS